MASGGRAEAFWTASGGPGAEAAVGRVEERWPQSLHLPGHSSAVRAVVERAGIFISEVQSKVPDPPPTFCVTL